MTLPSQTEQVLKQSPLLRDRNQEDDSQGGQEGHCPRVAHEATARGPEPVRVRDEAPGVGADDWDRRHASSKAQQARAAAFVYETAIFWTMLLIFESECRMKESLFHEHVKSLPRIL